MDFEKRVTFEIIFCLKKEQKKKVIYTKRDADVDAGTFLGDSKGAKEGGANYVLHKGGAKEGCEHATPTTKRFSGTRKEQNGGVQHEDFPGGHPS